MDKQITSKVVVIGAGSVGSTVAYTLMWNTSASEIVLIDVNNDKAVGEALDMNHGLSFHKQLTIRGGDYSDCADAGLIIVTAGLGRKPGQSRIDLAKNNVAVARDIAQNIMKHATNPLILVISNPVDILTYVIQKETGLPPHRVIGSGTILDTSRFRFLLSQHCDIDVRNVHAFIIGEHGDSEVPVWSSANIGGKPFAEMCDDCPRKCQKVNREHIYEKVKGAGAEIIAKKGATFYGVSMGAARIANAIMGDENSVLTVSSSLYGEYGLSGVALSLPYVINRNGIDRVVKLNLTDEERAALAVSAQKLKDVLAELEVE